MSFDLFGPTKKKDIRVGYISTDRGYVKGISILEANKYAFKNPGTMFILETRDSTRYLTINEVNKLTPKDILPSKNSSEGTCDGIVGLTPGQTGISTDQSPIVIISGCGGVGARGVPVVGRDGSLLDVIVRSGGFGYTCPPNVTVVDPNRRGAGVVAISSVGLTTISTVEYYTDLDDFEEYDFNPDNGDQELPGYGQRFGVNGEVLGDWDPTLFATFSEDPIGREIQKYQDFLRELPNPWWHTRKEKPLTVSFGDKASRVAHHVTYPAWDGNFMNQYAISPVPPSNVPGSDYAGRVATFEWEENFPYTGEYIFRGMADNSSKLYLDNELLIAPANFKGGPLPKDTIKKTIQEGVHRIKIDLLNKPILETIVSNNTKEERVPVDFDVYGQGSDANMKIKFVFSSSDGKHSFTLNNVDTNEGSYTKNIRVIPNMDYKVQAVMTGNSIHEVVTTKNEREIDISYEGLNSSNNPINVSSDGKTIRLKDGSGDDTNAKFKIQSSSPGVKVKFSPDGKKLIVKGDVKGNVTIKLNWDDNPFTAGTAVKKIKILDKTWVQNNEKGEQTETINFGKPQEGVEKKDKALEQGFARAFGQAGGAGAAGDGTTIFADYVGSLSDSDDMQVRAKGGIFTKSNPRKVTGTSGQGTQTRTTYDLTYKFSANNTTSNSRSSNQSQGSGEIFNTIDYINKADRQLWRTNVYTKGGFLNDYGISPFNTALTLPDNPYDGEHVIRWEHINFPADGNYKIEVEVDDSVKIYIGNRSGNGAMEIGNGLRSVEEGGDEVIIEKNGFVADSSKGTGKSTYIRYFKKGQYRIRAELYQKPGGIFSYNPSSTPSGLPPAEISARFVREGNDTYLVVDGQGTATIRLNLNVDDNPRVAGDSLGSVRVGSVNLSRTRESTGSRSKKGQYKEKEILSAEGTFTAGQRYKVIVGGASAGVQRPRVNSNNIEFLDKSGNDTNATLSVGRISGFQPAPVKGINPMALAINITADISETTTISPKTWNENPMGIAYTIDAPFPPIPQEPRVFADSRCPENPMWTTRFAGGSEKWWPVNHIADDGTKTWSKFMNRYAISPIPPLDSPNTDGGGIIYSNTWNLDIPYDGFYALKGAVDNGGRILIDGNEIIRGGFFEGSSFRINRNSDPIKSMIGFDYSPGNQDNEGVYFGYEVDYPNAKAQGFTDVDVRYYLENDFPGLIGPKMQLKLDDPNWGRQKINLSDTQNGLVNFRSVSPPLNKFFLSKGKHTITVEVENKKTASQNKVEKKIFATKDWVKSQVPPSDVDVNFRVTSSADYANSVEMVGQFKYSKTYKGSQINESTTKKLTRGVVYDVIFDSNQGRDVIKLRNKGKTVVEMEDATDNDFTDIIVSASEGRFYGFNGRRCKFILDPQKGEETTTRKNVTYSGPQLFQLKFRRWSNFMNSDGISPYIPPLDIENRSIVGDNTFTWSNVEFPESGRYKILFQSDDKADLYINGNLVKTSRAFVGTPVPSYVEVTKGNYEVKVVCNNIDLPSNIFNRTNPTGIAVKITKDVVVSGESLPWTTNPVGISAILIPPPCPKVIDGKGVVTDIEVRQPGNGFVAPPGTGIPSLITVKRVNIDAPGINYSPDDEMLINGIPAPITTDPFGRIVDVEVPPIIVTETPSIELPSNTGVGFRGTPILRTTIVPEDVFDPEDLIQVTDLVGLKQTGYVNGKPYYGSVFSKDGQLFAGVYETIGELIPVYATLQESIDNRITTRPSAIIRQGTDVNSNNPRLNIPGTPDNLV